MRNRFGTRLACTLCVCTVLASCASAGSRDGPPGDRPAHSRTASVLTSDQLLTRGTSNLLVAIGTLVPNLHVHPASPCPRVTFRGERSIVLRSDPMVYVNGARVADTCALEQIPIREVERVELYPTGSPGPGYAGSPYGSILVFLTDR